MDQEISDSSSSHHRTRGLDNQRAREKKETVTCQYKITKTKNEPRMYFEKLLNEI